MNIKTFSDAAMLASHAGDSLAGNVLSGPASLIACATGDSPTLTYRQFVKVVSERTVDRSRLSFVALDEWLGVPPDQEGSCAFYLYQHIFNPLQIKNEQIHLFDALTTDADKECREMEAFISTHGGIDVLVLGLGLNGHIGFNEPGTQPSYTHAIELDEQTRVVGQKYFKRPMQLERGITLGLKTIMSARRVILIATGPHKAEIVRTIVTGEISGQVPATILRRHNNCDLFLDHDAAALLPHVPISESGIRNGNL